MWYAEGLEVIRAVPLYEYECPKCGRFEKIQKFSAKPLRVCPTCKGRKVERLLSAPAIQFKGSGWYVTDYARKGGEPKGDGKGDGKGDAGDKPAAGDGAQKPDAAASSKTSSTPDKATSDQSAAKSKRTSKSSTTQN